MFSKVKEYAKYAIPFALGVLIYAFITNFQETRALFTTVLSGIWYVSGRFIVGFGMAYILDFLVSWMCKRLRFPRWLGITISYIVFLGVIVWMIVYIIPLVGDSLTQILALVSKATPFVEQTIESLQGTEVSFLVDVFNSVAVTVTETIKNIVNYSTVESLVRGSTRAVINSSFAILVSLYALIEKQALLRHSRQLICVLQPEDKAKKILTFLKESNEIFSKYLVGKTLDSTIIGICSLIAYTVVGIPYPLTPFLAIVAAVTNMIPYFGPIIGGIIAVFIMFCYNPIHALYVLIIVVGLQTLDGFVIGPRILGDAVGISPLLTIISITIGGDIAGFTGIFLGIPVMAVLKIMVYDRWIARKLISKELDTAI